MVDNPLMNLTAALEHGAKAVHNRQVYGASTFAMATLRNNKLSILNLGDSGIAVFRPSVWRVRHAPSVLYARLVKTSFSGSGLLNARCRKIFRTEKASHRKNTPYDIHNLPGEEYRSQFDSDLDFMLSLVDCVSVDVQEGDVVIAFTDGVMDNISMVQVSSFLIFVMLIMILIH